MSAAPSCQYPAVCPCEPHQAEVVLYFACGCAWHLCRFHWMTTSCSYYCPVCGLPDTEVADVVKVGESQ